MGVLSLYIFFLAITAVTETYIYVVGVNWCSLSARLIRVVGAVWDVYMVETRAGLH